MKAPQYCLLYDSSLFFLAIIAEHERMVEAYAMMDQKLQQALLEHDNFENNVRNLKVHICKYYTLICFNECSFNIHIPFSLS
jgi:hypothetical protein